MLCHSHLLAHISDDVSEAISTEMSDTSRTLSSAVTHLDTTLPPTSTTATETAKVIGSRAESDCDSLQSSVVNENGDVISFHAGRVQLAKHLLSSQTLSCTRLSDCVQKKIPLMQNFNSGF